MIEEDMTNRDPPPSPEIRDWMRRVIQSVHYVDDLDLPPGFSRPALLRAARLPCHRGDPCQRFVADLLPPGWQVETDVGPDLLFTSPDGTASPWLSARDLGITTTCRGQAGDEEFLLYVSDVRRMTRAFLASLHRRNLDDPVRD